MVYSWPYHFDPPVLKQEQYQLFLTHQEKVPVNMELFIQLVIGSAISSFAILIVSAGISSLEVLLKSISSINFMNYHY